MTPRHVRGILLDRPDARGLARLRGTQDVEPGRGGRMSAIPASMMLEISVAPFDPACNLCREGFHLGVEWIRAVPFRPVEFFLAEAVAKPAHGETMEKPIPSAS